MSRSVLSSLILSRAELLVPCFFILRGPPRRPASETNPTHRPRCHHPSRNWLVPYPRQPSNRSDKDTMHPGLILALRGTKSETTCAWDCARELQIGCAVIPHGEFQFPHTHWLVCLTLLFFSYLHVWTELITPQSYVSVAPPQVYVPASVPVSGFGVSFVEELRDVLSSGVIFR